MKLFLTGLLITIAGCAALGLTSPKTFDQSLAAAYGTHTAILSATTTAVNAHAITSTEAALVQTQANTARGLLDAAKAAETANPTGAQNNLTLAVTALTALQSYLNAQGATK